MPRVLIRGPRDLGLALSTARTSRGMTQEGLAESLGLDRSYLARMESGLTTLLLERTLRVLRRLGAELVVEIPDPDPAAGTHPLTGH